MKMYSVLVITNFMRITRKVLKNADFGGRIRVKLVHHNLDEYERFSLLT